MAKIHTLRGAIDSSDLGYTLSHEHIFVHDEGVVAAFPQVWDQSLAVRKAREKLMQVYDCGVRTIMDQAVLGNGRNVALLLEAIVDLPINIIVATGTFYKDELPGFFQSQDADVLADFLVHDIEVGIGDTGVRAGVVKACTDMPGVTFGAEKALRAAARAHMRTGAVLHTHAHAPTKRGLEQQRIFAEEGVDLRKVYIGHAINSDDMDYLHGLLDRGSFVGFDRWAAGPLPQVPGMPTHPPVTAERAVQTLAALCREGYARQILIGNDGCSYQTVVRFHDVEQSPGLNENDYLMFPTIITPMLLEAGVTQRQIDTMTIGNPRRLFELNAR